MKNVLSIITSNTKRLIFSRLTHTGLLVVFTLVTTTGLIVPQVSRLSPLEYQQWHLEHPVFASLIEAMGLNQVFSSPLFGALSAFMALTTVIVNLRRARALLSSRHRIASVPDLDSFSHAATFDNPYQMDNAARIAARVLAAQGYRPVNLTTKSGRNYIVGKRGTAGSWGSIIFHLSLVVVFAGAVLVSLAGPTGLMVLTEGQTMRDVVDDYLIPPEKSLGSDFTGTPFRLEKITVDYYEGRQLTEFGAVFTVMNKNSNATENARANEPLYLGGKAFVLRRYGFAPEFIVRDRNGREAFRSYVNLMVDRNGDEDGFVIPQTGLTVNVRLYPDAVERDNLTGLRTESMVPRNPVAYVTVSNIEKEISRGKVALNETMDMAGGSISFSGLRYWVLLQVNNTGAEPVLFTGFLLVILSLVLRFGVVEECVAVRVVSQKTGSRVTIFGQARQFEHLYSQDFGNLVVAIAREVGVGVERSNTVLDSSRSVLS